MLLEQMPVVDAAKRACRTRSSADKHLLELAQRIVYVAVRLVNK